ncbi:Imm53 family immunity protein [Streptomyces vinaceus]|uniref:Imm53 family immunity protein n=1 Tax=Streptomyces vinaceus TaxID=1960 RepID=UPI0037F49F0D
MCGGAVRARCGSTLDNPGWTVEIDLEETDLEGREYPRQDVNRNTQDWVRAWTAEKTFHAACGPGNLGEALAIFRTWATTSAP